MFKLSWFKTRKKEEELLDLQIRKEKLLTDSIEQARIKLEELKPQRDTAFQSTKPYRRVKLVNDVLTVIFNDGSVINKAQASVLDFEKIREAVTESEVMEVMHRGINIIEKEDDSEPSYKDIEVVSNFPDFETKESCIYMNNIERSVPPLLVKRFGEILSKYDHTRVGWENDALNDVEYSSLKKFWLKCCLNPNAQSAEDLYTFLSYHNMKIDRHGNFFAYRRVVKVNQYAKDTYNGTEELVDVISRSYNNVKAIWKKKPVNFRIEYTNGNYSLHKVTSTPKGTIIGNLETLYLDLPNMKENRYTDAHTRTMDYRVGQIASIPRNECNNNNNVNCSKGLHSASKKYDYSGFGDTPILMIINPMDAVAVPLNEVGKLRVSRFFFAMTLDKQDKYILDDEDFDVTDLGDIFEEKCLLDIEDHVHKSFAEEIKRHTFVIPQISDVSIKDISNTLRLMNQCIKDRIITK